MSEVPEHLLQRSAARRAALSGGEAPAEASSEAGTSVEQAEATPAAAAAPAAAVPAEVEEAPKPVPPYVAEALTRKKIPFWAMSVIGLLPLWAILYAGSLSESDDGELTQLDLGEEIYNASCATCHGAAGGGGVGRAFTDGELLATFPDIEAQVEFIALGSSGVGNGNPYGDPTRAGGPRIAGSSGAQMPAFGETLSAAEIFAVARYERELSGEEVDAEMLDPDGALLQPNGDPYVDEAGELVNADGEPLLDDSYRLTVQIASGQAGATLGAGS